MNEPAPTTPAISHAAPATAQATPARTTTTPHTALPWRHVDYEILSDVPVHASNPGGTKVPIADLRLAYKGSAEMAANGDFIVRACNAHGGLVKALTAASHALKSYAHGNASTELAAEAAAACDAALALARGGEAS